MKNILLGILVAASGLCMAAPAAAQSAPSTAIVSGRTNQCWDVQNYSIADGAIIQMWDCTGTSNQAWSFQVYSFSGSDSLARIVNVNSGMCVAAESVNPASGAIGLVQKVCNNNDPLQQWQIEKPTQTVTISPNSFPVPLLNRHITNVGNHWCVRTEDTFFRPVVAASCGDQNDQHSRYKMVGV